MAEIYIGSIHQFKTLNGIELVTKTRGERIHRYLRTEDKARCLLAGLLLRQICGVTDDCQLIYNENDKPYLKSSDTYFNISHSGDYVVLATANREVGVDVEKVIPCSDEAAACCSEAARCFTPQELEWIQHEGFRGSRDEAFYRLWTAKESVMKASGLGFSLSPETFCVLPLDSSAHYIAGKSWFLNWLYYDGHVICCAVEGEINDKPWEIKPVIMNPGDLLERG